MAPRDPSDGERWWALHEVRVTIWTCLSQVEVLSQSLCLSLSLDRPTCLHLSCPALRCACCAWACQLSPFSSLPPHPRRIGPHRTGRALVGSLACQKPSRQRVQICQLTRYHLSALKVGRDQVSSHRTTRHPYIRPQILPLLSQYDDRSVRPFGITYVIKKTFKANRREGRCLYRVGSSIVVATTVHAHCSIFLLS